MPGFNCGHTEVIFPTAFFRFQNLGPARENEGNGCRGTYRHQ